MLIREAGGWTVVEVAPDPRRVAEYVAAVAHSGGGDVVIKIPRDALTGLEPARTMSQLAELMSACPIRSVESAPHGAVRISVEARNLDEGPIIVPGGSGTGVHVTDSLLGYKTELSRADVDVWHRRAGDSPDDLAVTSMSTDFLDRGRLSTVATALNLPHFCDIDLEQLGVARLVAGRPRVTLAGLVALCTSPGALHPAGRVLVHRHAGGLVERGGAPLSTVLVDGGVEALLKEVARLSPHLDELRPLIREVLVNAVAHRSYFGDALKESVQVHVFTDGIRVSSPGRPLGRVLGRSGLPDKQYRRNRHLATLLAMLGFADGRGRGMDLLAAALRRDKARVEMSADAAHCVVSVGTPRLSTGRCEASGRRVRVRGRVVRGRAPARTSRSETKPAAGVDGARVVELLTKKGAMTRREIQEALGTGRSTTGAMLARLCDDGLVRREGAARSPSVRYLVASAP